MTTLNELQTELHRAIGDDSDSTNAILVRAINAGIIATVLLFEPANQRTNANLVANTSGTVPLSGLTRYLKVDTVWNANANQAVHPLSLMQLQLYDSLLPANGNVEFYALHGSEMHYRPKPGGNQTLNTYFLQRPAKVSDTNDTIPMEEHEEFIMSFAMEYYWAFKEEGESSEMWQKISDRLAIPYNQLATVRKALRGDPPYDHNVRGAVQPSTAQT